MLFVKLTDCSLFGIKAFGRCKFQEILREGKFLIDVVQFYFPLINATP